MKSVKITIAIILIMLMQGCAYLDYQYFKLFKLESSSKNDLIVQLIQHPELYDSLLTNSKFYHKEYSKHLLTTTGKNNNIAILDHFKRMNNNEPYIDDAFYYMNKEKTWYDNVSYLYDKNNIECGVNVLGVSYEMYESDWYITGIRTCSYAIQIRGID